MMSMGGRRGSQTAIVHDVFLSLFFVGILVAPQMAWTAQKDQSRASGRSYSIPVPNGFVIMESARNSQVAQLRSAGGLVLVQRERSAFENAYLAHVVVAPTHMPGKMDLQSKRTCGRVAYRGAGSVGGTVQAAGIAELPSGRSCQYTVRYPTQANRAATATIFATPEETWVLTCNYDIRDAAAISACTQVVDGWRFTR